MKRFEMVKAEQIKIFIQAAPSGLPVVIPRQSTAPADAPEQSPVEVPAESPVDPPAAPTTVPPKMTEDSSGITESQWATFKKWGCRGTDFDWFALDREGHLGVFTTAREGPVPLPIWEHCDQFLRLQEWVKSLPSLAPAVQVFVSGANYREWSEYALKGLFAFDYQSDLGAKEPEGYDLIAQPTATMNVRHPEVEKMVGWLPVLDLDFSASPVVSTAFILPYGVHE